MAQLDGVTAGEEPLRRERPLARGRGQAGRAAAPRVRALRCNEDGRPGDRGAARVDDPPPQAPPDPQDELQAGGPALRHAEGLPHPRRPRSGGLDQVGLSGGEDIEGAEIVDPGPDQLGVPQVLIAGANAHLGIRTGRARGIDDGEDPRGARREVDRATDEGSVLREEDRVDRARVAGGHDHRVSRTRGEAGEGRLAHRVHGPRSLHSHAGVDGDPRFRDDHIREQDDLQANAGGQLEVPDALLSTVDLEVEDLLITVGVAADREDERTGGRGDRIGPFAIGDRLREPPVLPGELESDSRYGRHDGVPLLVQLGTGDSPAQDASAEEEVGELALLFELDRLLVEVRVGHSHDRRGLVRERDREGSILGGGRPDLSGVWKRPRGDGHPGDRLVEGIGDPPGVGRRAFGSAGVRGVGRVRGLGLRGLGGRGRRRLRGSGGLGRGWIGHRGEGDSPHSAATEGSPARSAAILRRGGVEEEPDEGSDRHEEGADREDRPDPPPRRGPRVGRLPHGLIQTGYPRACSRSAWVITSGRRAKRPLVTRKRGSAPSSSSCAGNPSAWS